MAEAIVGPLLSKLQQVAVREGKALARVGNEIDRLRDKLMWLHALVHEMDLRTRSDSNQLVRVLACQMREVAFAAEDAIDSFFLEADLSRFSHDWLWAASMFFANFSTQIRVRYILSRKIKYMNTRLENILDNSTKYRSNNGSTAAITWRASRAIPPVRQNWEDKDLDGQVSALKRTSEKIDLMKLLKDKDKPPVHVIYVVGDSGMGKRYLVKKTCEDATIKENFGVPIWVSFPPDTSNITGQINKKLEEAAESSKKSKLVVVDCPVSSIVVDEKLLKVREGSKIGVVVIGTSSPPHKNGAELIELKHLNKQSSKGLFNYAVGLGGRRKSRYKTEMMDKLRDHIEEITNGLPLAVVLLAKFMRSMDYNKWEASSDYLRNNNQDDLLNTIVSMGVDDLPDELKSCLLYTAGFPEHSTIPAGQLVRLWMAEGFLTQQLGVEPEELGQRYLKELIFRGLVQLVEKKGDDVESIGIHDLVHQFFRSEVQRTGFMETHYGGLSAPVPDSARRLALKNKKFPDKGLEKLRTVLSHGHDGHPAQGSQGKGFSQLLEHSTFLRVISLEGVNIGEELPSQIVNMLHLQYLGVRCQALKTVPDSIGKLRNLQTMDVRETQVKELPKSFWEIKALRHVVGNDNLHFPDFAGHLKPTTATELEQSRSEAENAVEQSTSEAENALEQSTSEAENALEQSTSEAENALEQSTSEAENAEPEESVHRWTCEIPVAALASALSLWCFGCGCVG